MVKLINISQLASLLNLVNSKTKKPSNYILRYWEKEFEVLDPIKRNGNRRYYTQNDILTILKINDLISSHGFTIEGAKQKLLSISNSSNAENHTLLLLKKDIQKIIDVLDK